MSKVLVIPDYITEYEMSDSTTEILVLNKNMKRLDIQHAPALKKIISLSNYVVFGPKNPKASMPVLNNAPQLNEIITYGYIKFNTMISNGKLNKLCAWTGLDENPPTLTSVGSEYLSKFPCYYYDVTRPIEEIDSFLNDAYPVVRECQIDYADLVIKNAFDNPDVVSAPVFTRR